MTMVWGTDTRARQLAIGVIVVAAVTLGTGAADATRAAATTGPRAIRTVADRSAVNGTYRVTISDADLRANGVTDPGAIRENHGIFTWFLHDGSWRLHQRTSNPVNPPGPPAPYTVKGDRITFVFAAPGAPPGAPPPLTMRWKLASRELHFTVIRGGDPIVRTLFTAHPWKKIG